MLEKLRIGFAADEVIKLSRGLLKVGDSVHIGER